MIISESCRPGAWKNREGWLPKCEWPEDCYVQWGDDGVVFTEDGNYRTAFFESFPGTFIRGEGKTIPEAEQDAWKQYQRILNCPGHEYEKRGYTNGLGICKHCEMSKSDVFEPEKIEPEKLAAHETMMTAMKEALANQNFMAALGDLTDAIVAADEKCKTNKGKP